MNKEILLKKFFNGNENGIVTMEYAIVRLGTRQGTSELFEENNFNNPTTHGRFRIELISDYAGNELIVKASLQKLKQRH
ncbi:MAG: hypothetical protein WCI97_04975 [Bacteroidota bacterium]